MRTEDAIDAFGGRKKGGLKKLAAALGITVQSIYQWGEEVPRLREYQIRDLLAVSQRELFETSPRHPRAEQEAA